jgi:predicted DNA binding CopG/RHH family protein
MKYFDLTPEENEIEQALEKGKIKPVTNLENEKKRYTSYARYTLAKTRNINIRVSEKTLMKLKARAIFEGIPYQTLAGSIIHKYTSGEIQ